MLFQIYLLPKSNENQERSSKSIEKDSDPVSATASQSYFCPSL